MLNLHKDRRFGTELNWVLVELCLEDTLLSFCGFVMCVLLYVAVIVNFGFNFLIGIYPFEHLCFFCVCYCA